jgi:hypothetical protein
MFKITSEWLEEAEETIKEAVLNSSVVNFDESGMNVNGARHWVHLAVTNIGSYF